MHLLRQVLYYFVIMIAAVVILLSMASLVHDVAYWYTKVLDFPRTQYLITAVLCLLLFGLLNRQWTTPALALTLGLIATIGIQSFDVVPYLMGPKPVPDARPEEISERNTVSLLLANVLISNRQSDAFLKIVLDRDPDLLLVMENDRWWADRLVTLGDRYPYTMEYPAGNGYGMSLYSKLPLTDRQTQFFSHDSVPSFHVRVTLPDDRSFRLHAMHPVAPVPSDRFPDNRGEKEVAFNRLAEMLARDSLPIMVAGDFNDVSWSHTSRLLQARGKLHNVRLGRGLYNSFDAHSILLRWPLDHYFVSEQFGLIELERLPAFGSDHFPMFARFVLR